MKYLKFLGLCLCCFIVCERVSSQSKAPLNEPATNKPRLFTNQPDRISVNLDELQTLFSKNTETGSEVELQFSEKQSFILKGKLIAATNKYDNKIHTLIIRSSNFSGATLTLSSSTNPDGTVEYSGRIISFQHGDLYELEKQNEQYFLIKKNFNDLVNE